MRDRLPIRVRAPLRAVALAVGTLCLGGPSAPGAAREKQPERAKPDEKGVSAEFLADAKNYDN